MPIKSCSSSVTEATTDSAMFAEDRSDKSQYVANPVMRQSDGAATVASSAADTGTSAKAVASTSMLPTSSSRLDNYRLQVTTVLLLYWIVYFLVKIKFYKKKWIARVEIIILNTNVTCEK